MKNYDVIIIGAGSGGLSARREVAKKTDNYLLIDGGTLGTTCARVGCMPSKVLIQVAEDFHRREKHAEQGILNGDQLQVDSKLVMQHVRKLRDRFVRAVVGDMESWMQTHFLKGFAKFISPHEVEVDGKVYRADKFVIATGSKPIIPQVFKGHEDALVTTDEFFELNDLEGRWAVIGLGVIGLELGQAIHRLGKSVVGIGRRKVIAGITDPVINEYAVNKFACEMNLSFEGIQKVERSSGGIVIHSGAQKFEVDRVLVTTGRIAQWRNLNFEALGCTEHPIPEFNPKTFQLFKFPHILLAGDNTGLNQILHEASDEGKIAGYNAVNPIQEFKTRTPLMITFCDPNIAFAGASYEELESQGRDFEIGEVSFEGQGRSIVKLKEIGHLRVYGERQSGKILGAELMAPSGEHLAHLLSWVISQEMTVNQVLALPFYHPVIEEGLRTALRDLRGKVAEPIPSIEINV